MKLKLASLLSIALTSIMFSFTNVNQTVNANENTNDTQFSFLFTDINNLNDLNRQIDQIEKQLEELNKSGELSYEKMQNLLKCLQSLKMKLTNEETN